MNSRVDTEFPYQVHTVDRGVDCRDPVCRHRFRFPDLRRVLTRFWEAFLERVLRRVLRLLQVLQLKKALTLQSLPFLAKKKRGTPEKARKILSTKPLKFLEKRAKTHKKARKIAKRKKQGKKIKDWRVREVLRRVLIRGLQKVP